MNLFGFGKATPSRGTVLGDLVARYKRLRPIRLRLNNELVGRLSRDVLNDGAKRIGILRGGTFVFDSEDEASVLMDYCIYDVYRKGRNAVEQYLCDCPPDPESDEMECLRAMQHATYALVVIDRVEPGVGCHVRNMYTDETRLLVDMGLSKTARHGAMMATRLLDFGEYLATSGAALPLGVLGDDKLDDWQRKLRAGMDDIDRDPAPVIRACLERGASSNIRYEGVNANHRLDVGGEYRPARTSSQRRRKPAKRLASKASTNRRCGCGSGKMFKNCCGKLQSRF